MTSNYHKELIQVAAVALAALQDELSGDTSLRPLYRQDNGAINLVKPVMDDKLAMLLERVAEERYIQEVKWGVQHHSKEHWLAILTEEVGEVAKDILENP